ncbi:triose-phosphate transporter [Fusarium albosuccineum]|uniref:GDP-mannose transporter n=1 Tax=Fusarium albosuccineum TaxID=1237068 RepID=A0A8H4P9R3_9HYPO|nr:triose-phosphate transporter [Fusarium albosuccineum]
MEEFEHHLGKPDDGIMVGETTIHLGQARPQASPVLVKKDPIETSSDVLEFEGPDDGSSSETQALPSSSTGCSIWTSSLWITVNTVATVGIVCHSRLHGTWGSAKIDQVFTNKAIFSDPALGVCQLTFASFHFLVTWLTLHLLSRPPFAVFAPRRVAVGKLIPLAVAMCLNVILPNLSLAHSSVVFYQLARILVTPAVALINLFLYHETLPLAAVYSLITLCLGVALVIQADSSSTMDEALSMTSQQGILFAFSGVFASALYTVWIASYHRKLQMTSMQLLHNQAPVASVILLYVIPFIDIFPDLGSVPVNRWLMAVMSGMFASLINISQFYIVAQTGPLSSTVVGHVKTCAIVALGWALSGRSFNIKGAVGVIQALIAAFAYSAFMLKHKGQKGSKLGHGQAGKHSR